MKKPFIVLLISLFLVACGQETFTPNVNSSQDEINKLFDEKCIVMFDNQYIITITEAEALNLGVSKETYRQMCLELELGNKMLRDLINEYENDPTVTSWTIEDCTYQKPGEYDIDHNIPLVKTRTESGSDQIKCRVVLFQLLGKNRVQTGAGPHQECQ